MTEKKKGSILKSKSVALHYNKSEIAPKLVAKGSGINAKKIIDIAKENDIPVITDSNLTDNIYQLEINEFVPEELFEILATIYSFVMKKREIKDEKED